jgi:hypothetical protein
LLEIVDSLEGKQVAALGVPQRLNAVFNLG